MSNLNKNSAKSHDRVALIHALISHGINPKGFSKFLKESIEASRSVLQLKTQGRYGNVDALIQADIELTQAEIFMIRLENELLSFRK